MSNDEYTDKLKNHVLKSLRILDQNGTRYDQIMWEYTKFEIRQFSITFSKNMSKFLNAEREILKEVVKDFKKSGSSYFDNEGYLAFKTKLGKKSMMKKLRVLELEASVTGTKKEKNLLYSS